MLRPFGAVRISILLLAVVGYAIFEASIRYAQGGCYNYMPFRVRDSLRTLPPSANFCFINSERAHIAYVTDREGARRESPSRTQVPCEHCVMTVGDSQALGYGIPYESTFTAIYAARTKRQSLLVAAPSDDPDYERLSTAHYVAATGTIPDTVFVVINFGNDLDELFLGRQLRERPGTGASFWLPEHSFVYADLALAGRILTRRLVHTSTLPPGTNPVVYALAPSELPIAEAELARVTIAIAAESKARNAVAILIPPDDAVYASEFAKYRRYFTAGGYALWQSRLPHMTAVMTAVEDGLARRLRAHGMHVLDTRRILERIPPALAFDRYSHHLTAFAKSDDRERATLIRLAAFVATIVLLGAEIAGRTFVPAAWSPPVFRPVPAMPGYALRADYGTKNGQVRLTIDSLGHRTVGSVRPDGTARTVHVIGGSYVFGSELDDAATIPSRLAALLGRAYRVVNDGVPGYGPFAYARLSLSVPARDISIILLAEEDDLRAAFSASSPNSVRCGYLVPRGSVLEHMPCVALASGLVRGAVYLRSLSLRATAPLPLSLDSGSTFAAGVLSVRVGRLLQASSRRAATRPIVSVRSLSGASGDVSSSVAFEDDAGVARALRRAAGERFAKTDRSHRSEQTSSRERLQTKFGAEYRLRALAPDSTLTNRLAVARSALTFR